MPCGVLHSKGMCRLSMATKIGRCKVVTVSMQLMHFNMASLFLLLSQLLCKVWVHHSDIRMTKQSPVPSVAPELIVTLHSRVESQSRVTEHNRV
jgi:hypothetical protein